MRDQQEEQEGSAHSLLRSRKLQKHAEDNFLIEVSRELTKKGVLLDLLGNRESLAAEAMTGGCLGHCNQEMLKFKLFGDRGKNLPAELPPWIWGQKALGCSRNYFVKCPGNLVLRSVGSRDM